MFPQNKIFAMSTSFSYLNVDFYAYKYYILEYITKSYLGVLMSIPKPGQPKGVPPKGSPRGK